MWTGVSPVGFDGEAMMRPCSLPWPCACSSIATVGCQLLSAVTGSSTTSTPDEAHRGHSDIRMACCFVCTHRGLAGCCGSRDSPGLPWLRACLAERCVSIGHDIGRQESEPGSNAARNPTTKAPLLPVVVMMFSGSTRTPLLVLKHAGRRETSHKNVTNSCDKTDKSSIMNPLVYHRYPRPQTGSYM